MWISVEKFSQLWFVFLGLTVFLQLEYAFLQALAKMLPFIVVPGQMPGYLAPNRLQASHAFHSCFHESEILNVYSNRTTVW